MQVVLAVICFGLPPCFPPGPSDDPIHQPLLSIASKADEKAEHPLRDMVSLPATSGDEAEDEEELLIRSHPLLASLPRLKKYRALYACACTLAATGALYNLCKVCLILNQKTQAWLVRRVRPPRC